MTPQWGSNSKVDKVHEGLQDRSFQSPQWWT